MKRWSVGTRASIARMGGGSEFEFLEPKKSQAQADNLRKMGDRDKRILLYTVAKQ